MKHFKAQQLQSALAKTTKLLIGKNVKVTNRGVTAYVAFTKAGEVDHVNLPMIPPNASSEFVDALMGFLTHEVGHVLYTESKALRDMSTEGASARSLASLKNMINITEDCRIEQCLERDFRGALRNLDAVRQHVFVTKLEERRKEFERGEIPSDEFAGYLFPAWLRGLSGQLVCREYLEKNGLTGPYEDLLKRLPTLERELTLMENTADAAELAKKILAAMSGEEPEEEPEEESGVGTKSRKSEKGDKTKKGDSERSPKPADKDEGDPEDGTAGGDEDDADEEEGEDEDAGGAGEEGEDDAEDERESEGGEPGDEDSDEGSEGEGEPLPIDISKVRDFDDEMADALADMSVHLHDESGGYKAFTHDYDVVELAPESDEADIEIDQTEVEQVSHALRKEIERLLKAKSRAVNVSGYRRGRLHPASLYRLKLQDDRVFSRRHEGESKDVAISLLLDLSGSMRGRKLRTATHAAWAFAETLDRLKIKNEVIGFTSRDMTREQYSETAADYRDMCARMPGSHYNLRYRDTIYMPLFKGFDEGFGVRQKRRLSTFHQIMFRRCIQNVDGDSLRMAAQRLATRPEQRKVVIVFSDGAPAANCGGLGLDLRAAVQEVTDAGIETVGIGIQSNAVQSYYPRHAVIGNLGDLTGKTLGELKRILISQ